MKYYVNENCIGCGFCCDVCSEIFKMTSDGVAKAEDKDTNNEKAAEAMDGCPVGAIEEI